MTKEEEEEEGEKGRRREEEDEDEEGRDRKWYFLSGKKKQVYLQMWSLSTPLKPYTFLYYH